MEVKHISFLGAGRVGSALCRSFYEAGYIIDTIVSRTSEKARILAQSVDATWSDKADFPHTTDIIIVAVPDSSLGVVLRHIKSGSGTVVAHTAGSYSLDVFPERISRKGVIYPLQTFSEGRRINIAEVPFLLEAGDEETAGILFQLCTSISGNVSYTDADRRRVLHLAAVFACNFTNHMLAAGIDIAKSGGFSPEVLKPLILETISKAITEGPVTSQTGPAVRNDMNTIEKHLEMLSSEPVFRDLYKTITYSIIEYYKKR